MDPILAVGSLNIKETAAYSNRERYEALNNFGQLENALAGGPQGAHLHMPISIPEPQGPMNLVAMGNQFNTGLRVGFIQPHLDAFVQKVNDPTLSQGEMLTSSIEFSHKMAAARLFQSETKELASSLKSLVLGQG